MAYNEYKSWVELPEIAIDDAVALRIREAIAIVKRLQLDEVMVKIVQDTDKEPFRVITFKTFDWNQHLEYRKRFVSNSSSGGSNYVAPPVPVSATPQQNAVVRDIKDGAAVHKPVTHGNAMHQRFYSAEDDDTDRFYHINREQFHAGGNSGNSAAAAATTASSSNNNQPNYGTGYQNNWGGGYGGYGYSYVPMLEDCRGATLEKVINEFFTKLARDVDRDKKNKEKEFAKLERDVAILTHIKNRLAGVPTAGFNKPIELPTFEDVR